MPVVISIENLWKLYRLGVLSYRSLQQDLQSRWARFRGAPDPNSVIFSDNGAHSSGDRIWALKDVSLEIQEGQVLGIVGGNGAGKSTLLKIISRITAPTRGEAKIRGRVASILEVGTGFHSELTGHENIFLNGAILGMSVSEIRRKFDQIVDFSEIEEFIDTPVKRYSSGMYVRLAFAVAAHLDSEILILDEVLAVGDAKFQKKCIRKIHELSTSGKTILFVSHNLKAVQDLCQVAIHLEKGRLIDFSGDVQRLVRAYLNEDQMNGDPKAP